MINVIIYSTVILVSVYAGYSERFLTLSGSIAAAVVGGAVALGFGWKGFVVLGFFFLSSSLWSRFKREKKKRIEQKHEKGSQRDWQQVFANGGLAAILSIINFISPDQIWLLGFSIAIASANSDTWASEIGTLSKRPPIFIRTFTRAEKGTSGAVSLLGTLSGLGGSLLVAMVTVLLFNLNEKQILLILLFGFLGNIFDTILGAFFQAAYSCPICFAETEKKEHCQQTTVLVRGFSVLNNDTVNFLSGFLATAVASLFLI